MSSPKLFLTQTLRGLGQIMLQDNALSGILFLAGIAWGSPMMGLAAFYASALGTLTAIVLKFNSEKTNQGIYGFNAALVGVALLLFFKFSLILSLFITMGAILATLLHHFFVQRKIPAFTASFVLITWILIYILKCMGVPSSEILTPAPLWHSYLAPVRGFGQVIFQTDPISGLLFIAGIFINSSSAGIFSLIAAIISSVLAYSLSFPVNNIELGLFSYNAVLCAIVFARFDVKNMVLAFFAVILSIWMTQLFFSAHLIALTFPFVAATWIALIVGRLIIKKPLPN